MYSGDLGPYFGLQLRFEAHAREKGKGRGAGGVSPAQWSFRRGIHTLEAKAFWRSVELESRSNGVAKVAGEGQYG